MAKAARSKASPPEGGQGEAARVVTERRKLSDLRAAPYNPRTIAPAAMAGLSESVRRFGLVQPVVWNRQTGHVVGGHQRLKALEAQGFTETDVVVVDLPEIEEKALNLALNSPAIAGDFTPAAVELLEEVTLALPDLSEALLLPDLSELLRKDFKLGPAPLVTPPTPEPPAVPVTKLGDMIELGRHRLLCGDATNGAHVDRLLSGAVPGLMVTDPPYGVDYEGGASTSRKRTKLVGDESTSLFRPALREASRSMGDGAWYVWHAGRAAESVYATVRESRYEVRSLLIWNKIDPHFGAAGAHYLQAHECCLYAVRGNPAWHGNTTERSVWDIKQPSVNEYHPTQKPIECMARPIRNHDATHVYDPFLGSGTTLIAAEQLDRVCFGMEIEPRFCDVIVARWEALTGKKASRA